MNNLRETTSNIKKTLTVLVKGEALPEMKIKATSKAYNDGNAYINIVISPVGYVVTHEYLNGEKGAFSYNERARNLMTTVETIAAQMAKGSYAKVSVEINRSKLELEVKEHEMKKQLEKNLVDFSKTQNNVVSLFN